MSAELKGNLGERLKLSFRRVETWGDMRLNCNFKSDWAEIEIDVLVETGRLSDFSKDLRLLTELNTGNATFINADGNCEIDCVATPNGRIKVNCHLMPDMISDSVFHTSFLVVPIEGVSFASQIINLKC